ncbi:MAG: FAD-dependent thymidylate synthase [Planctomycetes bacterium]|nr:FAD-dependent thymidylate synthase [Planctomycetota bacterium]
MDLAERALLERFFSRVEPREHGDIYVVRALPQELRATLNGLYSRSRHSMRRTFLDRLRQGLESQGRTIEDFVAELETKGEGAEDLLAGVLVEKAGKFLRTYAIDHGHNSLREGAVVQLAVENVSQLFTRFVQRERRASFEESSTRYISFAREGHWRDPDVVAAGEPWTTLYDEAIDQSFAFYQESITSLRDHLLTTRPCPEGQDSKAWERAARAEAFDAARYLLTPAIHTKWGMIADARTIADTITNLASHELAEFRTLGERLREEAEREFPTLLAHARRNDYLSSTPETLRALAESLATGNVAEVRNGKKPAIDGAASTDAPHADENDCVPPHTVPSDRAGSNVRPTGPADIHVRLLSSPDELEIRLLASLVFEHTDSSATELMASIRELDGDAREALFARALEHRGPRDAMPEGFEGAGLFDFEALVDFGAYRDIGRHRKGFQQQQTLTTNHGYVVPKLFEEADLADRYRSVLEHAGDCARRIGERFPLAAQYVIPFAYLQRVRLQFDARQMAYFCELRSAPEGHFSYRDVAIRMAEALEAKAPRYARWLRVCKEHVFLGRITAETERDARRASREARAESQGYEL